MAAAVVALLATGCTKDDNQKVNDGRIKIFSENMTAASNGSKLLINPSNMAMEWLAGEKIKVNNGVYTIASNGEGGYTIGSTESPLADDEGFYYALYPGDDFNGNDVTISGTNSAPVMTLNNLVINMHSNGTHDVAFPMGVKVASTATEMVFMHLTAGFKLSLKTTTGTVTVDKLKVYVYGEDAVGTVNTGDGVSYTVKWNSEGMMPMVPVGEVGGITDRDLSYGSEMVFDMKTDGEPGVEFGTTAKSFCVPVTLATVKRITVVGFNGATQVFAKTSALASHVELGRHVMYPVKTIAIN